MKNTPKILSAFLFAAIINTEINAQTSPSGYQYASHKNMDGQKPGIGDYARLEVYVFVDDSLVNSTVNMRQPLWVKVEDVLSLPDSQRQVGKANPITDMLTLMGMGDSITVVIPIDSTMRLNPGLENAMKLEYNLVMKGIMTNMEYEAYLAKLRAEKGAQAELLKEKEAKINRLTQAILAQYQQGLLDRMIRSAESGLKYLIIQEGEGPKLESGQSVETSYYLMLPDGSSPDNSFKRGQPFEFQLGKGMVIRGWDEGLQLLNVGAKAVLFIPANLGYGDQGAGTIPANSELIFYVEIEKASWK